MAGQGKDPERERVDCKVKEERSQKTQLARHQYRESKTGGRGRGQAGRKEQRRKEQREGREGLPVTLSAPTHFRPGLSSLTQKRKRSPCGRQGRAGRAA